MSDENLIDRLNVKLVEMIEILEKEETEKAEDIARIVSDFYARLSLF